MDSPADELPPEILCHIFQLCAQKDGDAAKRQVSQVCERWRRSAISDASLWRDVQILPYRDMDATPFANLLHWLDVQFERSGSMTLDIVWSLDCAQQYNDQVIDLIKKKAPFHRWRTLLLAAQRSGADSFSYFPHPSYGTVTAKALDEDEGFLGLESLTILKMPSGPLLNLLMRTTSTLRVLDIGLVQADEKLSKFKPMLERISSLVLNRDSQPSEARLPPNVVRLRAGSKNIHLYPHLLEYHVTHCRFVQSSPPDLQSLVSLTVTSTLNVWTGCVVEMPNLQHISYGRLVLAPRAAIGAPLLDSLRLIDDLGTGVIQTGFHLETTLLHPGYLLSPRKSLLVDQALSPNALTRLLQVSQRIEHLSLRFLTIEDAKASIECITNPTTIQSACKALKKLHLILEWSDCETEASKEILALLKNRAQAAGSGLAVYGSWKGEGVFKRLV